MDRGAAFGGRAPWLPPQAPAANTALPSQAKPGQSIRLPGQTRVAPEEYREFLALGHGGIFDVDLDRVDPASAVWRQSDAVASDFFNYDLDETSWKEYCARVKDFQEQLALLPRGVPAGHIRHMAPGGAHPRMPALPGPAGFPLSPGGGRPPVPMPMPVPGPPGIAPGRFPPQRAPPMPGPPQAGGPPRGRGPPPGGYAARPGPAAGAAEPPGPAVPKVPAMSFDFGKKFPRRGGGGGGRGPPPSPPPGRGDGGYGRERGDPRGGRPRDHPYGGGGGGTRGGGYGRR